MSAREVRSIEVYPGDLCRATIHDNPANVAHAMADWFDDPDLCAGASAWLTELADLIGEHGRSAPEEVNEEGS